MKAILIEGLIYQILEKQEFEDETGEKRKVYVPIINVNENDLTAELVTVNTAIESLTLKKARIEKMIEVIDKVKPIVVAE